MGGERRSQEKLLEKRGGGWPFHPNLFAGKTNKTGWRRERRKKWRWEEEQEEEEDTRAQKRDSFLFFFS